AGGVSAGVSPRATGGGATAGGAVVPHAEARRWREVAGGFTRCGAAQGAGGAREVHGDDRVLQQPQGQDELPVLSVRGLAHRQRGGGERLQDGGWPTPEVGRDALARIWHRQRLPSARPVQEREGPVAGLLDSSCEQAFNFLPTKVTLTRAGCV